MSLYGPMLGNMYVLFINAKAAHKGRMGIMKGMGLGLQGS